MTPVEIVGYEVDEAGSPWALDNGQFALSNAPVYHKVKLWRHGHCVDGRAGNRYGQIEHQPVYSGRIGNFFSLRRRRKGTGDMNAGLIITTNMLT